MLVGGDVDAKGATKERRQQAAQLRAAGYGPSARGPLTHHVVQQSFDNNDKLTCILPFTSLTLSGAHFKKRRK